MTAKPIPRLLDLDGADLERAIDQLIHQHPVRYRPWTAKEDAFLRATYGQVDAQVIAQTLGRTRSAVDGHVTTLGLTRRGRLSR